jgi:AraC family transcriptional activator of pyochelin receptor
MKEIKNITLSSYDVERLNWLRDLILQDVGKHFSLKQLSAMAGLNRYKLTYGFHQLFELPVYEFLKKKRMELAKKELQSTDKPIKEIARMTGYSCSQAFTTAFKRFYRKTPGEVRKIGNE